jgi:hypothetical protein
MDDLKKGLRKFKLTKDRKARTTTVKIQVPTPSTRTI